MTVLVKVLAGGDLYLSLVIGLNGFFDQSVPIVQVLAFFIDP